MDVPLTFLITLLPGIIAMWIGEQTAKTVRSENLSRGLDAFMLTLLVYLITIPLLKYLLEWKIPEPPNLLHMFSETLGGLIITILVSLGIGLAYGLFLKTFGEPIKKGLLSQLAQYTDKWVLIHLNDKTSVVGWIENAWMEKEGQAMLTIKDGLLYDANGRYLRQAKGPLILTGNKEIIRIEIQEETGNNIQSS